MFLVIIHVAIKTSMKIIFSRNTCPDVVCLNGKFAISVVLNRQNSAKFTGKHLCFSLSLIRETTTLLKRGSVTNGSSKFCESFQKTLFKEQTFLQLSQ